MKKRTKKLLMLWGMGCGYADAHAIQFHCLLLHRQIIWRHAGPPYASDLWCRQREPDIMGATHHGRRNTPHLFCAVPYASPHWDEGKPFDEQPGIMDHVKYMAGFFAKGELMMGGPFLDNSGGMMVFAIATIEQARAIASDDPAVKAGLLTVNVKPWLAAFHR